MQRLRSRDQVPELFAQDQITRRRPGPIRRDIFQQFEPRDLPGIWSWPPFARHLTSSLPPYQWRVLACRNHNPKSYNRNDFAVCSNFEQSLPKKVTRRKRSSTNSGSGRPQGCRLVVQVSGGARRAQAAPPQQSRSNRNFWGKQGRHNF